MVDIPKKLAAMMQISRADFATKRVRKPEVARLSVDPAPPKEAEPVPEVKPKKDYKYNLIAKVDYWEDRKIAFDTKYAPSDLHSTILIQRREPLTKQEITIQRLIEGNNPRSYSLTERHLHRVQLRDDPRGSRSSRREPARLIDRIDAEGLKFLEKFKYLISINQRYLMSEVIRNVSGNFVNISIYTEDFDLSQIAFDQSFSDVIIAPDKTFFESEEWPIRRFVQAHTPEQAYVALVDVLHEFAPKDFDVLAPVYGEVGPDVGINPDNPKKYDLVIVMKGRSTKAKPCKTSFRQYLAENYNEDTVQGVLCAEEKLYRYKDLIADLPGSLATFLEMALLDGARVGVWYEDRRTDF